MDIISLPLSSNAIPASSLTNLFNRELGIAKTAVGLFGPDCPLNQPEYTAAYDNPPGRGHLVLTVDVRRVRRAGPLTWSLLEYLFGNSAQIEDEGDVENGKFKDMIVNVYNENGGKGRELVATATITKSLRTVGGPSYRNASLTS